MLKSLIYLIFFVPALAQAQIFVLGQGGYSQLNQKSAANNNVYPSGTSYAAGIGVRQDFFELEASMLKFNGEGDMRHDGVDNTFKHSQTSLILGLNFYLQKSFYLRFGYGFHRINQTLGTKVSEASEEGARKAYGMKDKATTDGILYGAGFVIFNGEKIDVYTQIENATMSSIQGSAWNASLGIKFYML